MSDSLQGKSSLHVVLAADNNYAVPLLVSIYSLYKTANEDTSYAVHVLVPPDFKSSFKDALNAMARDFGMPAPDFVDMGTAYADVKMQLEFITPQTYYRLMIPDLFDFDVCLYLDVDILVRKDLGELFSMLGKEDLIAGVKAAGYYWPVQEQLKKAQTLMIDAFDQYVNAGVLLINVRRMREQNMSSTFHKLMEKDFRSQDQDILNSACYGAIRLLPPAYNSMTVYDNDDASGYSSELHPCLPICYSKEEWVQACEDPAIIHYANRRKPWNSLAIPHALLWWDTLSEVNEYHDCKDVLIKQLAKGEAEHRRLDAATLADYKVELAEVRQDRARAWEEARKSRELVKETSERAREANEKLAHARESIQAFSKNTTARCDLKLTSEQDPQICVEDVSDPVAYTMVPTWFGKNETGYLISSNRGTLSFTIKCKTAGTLRILLRGSDARDAKGNRTDYWIKISSLIINDKPILKKDGLVVCYNDPYMHDMPVTANEEIRISYTWDVHTFEKELRQTDKELQRLADGQQRLIEEIHQLETTIAELEEQIRNRDAHTELLNAKLQKYEEELTSIKNSKAYRLAHAIGAPIRKLRAILNR